jgi:2-C-methyl-D-erythritol 4-phosphate cytidylyltransferase
VIVAAGAGVRAGPGEPKQFRPIAGIPMLQRALGPFLERRDVAQIVVALPPPGVAHPPPWLARQVGARLAIVAGGATRAESVQAGLAATAVAAPGVVLVHDGARPFVSPEIIEAVITRARSGIGAVAAVPVGDTLKDVADDGRVSATVPRARLWRAQTPQGFPTTMLVAAYAQWPATVPPPTDDAQVVERAGFPVEVVAGSVYNLKVTTVDDWRLAEALARELA